MTSDWPTADLLTHRAWTTPEAPAITDAEDGSTLSFGGLDQRAGALATAMEGHIAQSDRVALLLDTRVAFAAVYWAVRRRGGSVVPLNVRLATPELRRQLERVEPALLVCEDETEAVAVDLPADRVVSVDEPSTPHVDQLRAAESIAEPAPSTGSDEAAVLFTSGTTGRPKGVRLSVDNLLWSALGSALRLGVSRADRWLCCLPMYHTGGLAPIVRTVVYGSTLIVQRDFEPTRTAALMAEESVTGVSLVPTMLDRLLEAEWTPHDRLETVLLGGAPASQTLVERALEAEVPVAPTYGLTETASQVATAAPETVAAAPGSVGPPLLTTSVTVVDEEGTPVEPGEPGEIVVDGPTVTPGYLDASQTREATSSIGLHTGDRGHRDEDGRLYVHGRLDDLITTGGETVSPTMVVEALESHAQVASATVVGVPDEEWGERVGALIVPREGTAPPAETLADHCREYLAGYEIPTVWVEASSVPRTASGTVDRKAVRELLVADGQD